MATVNTPLIGVPTPDWIEKPDVPKWLNLGFSQAERYANIPVASTTDRDTKIPPVNRVVGQVTYRQDTKTFEFWDGTVWRVLNGVSAAPSHIAYATSTNYPMTPSGYKDFLMTIKVTQACVGLIWARATITVSATPTNYQSAYMSWSLDGTVSPWSARGLLGYPNVSAGGGFEMGGVGRWTLAPGSHTVGVRITSGAGSAAASIDYVSLEMLRAAGTANAAAGSGAYGEW
jgi:hypothetical protein